VDEDLFSTDDEIANRALAMKLAALRREQSMNTLGMITGDAPLAMAGKVNAGGQEAAQKTLMSVPASRVLMGARRADQAERDAQTAALDSPEYRDVTTTAINKFDPKFPVPPNASGRILQHALDSVQKKYVADQGNQARTLLAGMRGMKSEDDAKIIDNIAKAIATGEQAPDMKALYRYGAPLRSRLKELGVPLQQLQFAHASTMRNIQSMDGTKLSTFRIATDKAMGQVDYVQGLYSDLRQSLPSTRFPIINAAALKAARNGLLGPEVMAKAQTLDSQLALLAADMATVANNGNSGTDEGRKMLSALAKGEWDEKTFEKATGALRRDLQIGLSALTNLTPTVPGVAPLSRPNKSPGGTSVPPTGGSTVDQSGRVDGLEGIPDEYRQYLTPAGGG
jgi:hypothetical protein